MPGDPARRSRRRAEALAEIAAAARRIPRDPEYEAELAAFFAAVRRRQLRDKLSADRKRGRT
jgi:hypothetical protein